MRNVNLMSHKTKNKQPELPFSKNWAYKIHLLWRHLFMDLRIKIYNKSITT